MLCKLCSTTPKDWQGSDRKCAFYTGIFIKENWNCETMNRLRGLKELGDEQGQSGPMLTYNNGDQRMLVIPSNWIDDSEEHLCDFVIIGWYKSRGRTEIGLSIYDTESSLLTVQVAEAILKEYKLNGPQSPAVSQF
jgi:hypothetical protein